MLHILRKASQAPDRPLDWLFCLFPHVMLWLQCGTCWLQCSECCYVDAPPCTGNGAGSPDFLLGAAASGYASSSEPLQSPTAFVRAATALANAQQALNSSASGARLGSAPGGVSGSGWGQKEADIGT